VRVPLGPAPPPSCPPPLAHSSQPAAGAQAGSVAGPQRGSMEGALWLLAALSRAEANPALPLASQQAGAAERQHQPVAVVTVGQGVAPQLALWLVCCLAAPVQLPALGAPPISAGPPHSFLLPTPGAASSPCPQSLQLLTAGCMPHSSREAARRSLLPACPCWHSHQPACSSQEVGSASRATSQ